MYFFLLRGQKGPGVLSGFSWSSVRLYDPSFLLSVYFMFSQLRKRETMLRSATESERAEKGAVFLRAGHGLDTLILFPVI